MFPANPHERAVAKPLYFRIIYLFISERKYVPVITVLLTQDLGDLSSVHCLPQALM